MTKAVSEDNNQQQPENCKGSCLCGEVSYQFSGPVYTFQYCHCSRCQKFTGSAHASNLIVAAKNFQWLSGEDFIGRYEVEEAKYFSTSFCKRCGSSLPWMEQTGKSVIVTAGTLDEDPGVRPLSNLFWPDRPCWYERDGEKSDLPIFDGLPK